LTVPGRIANLLSMIRFYQLMVLGFMAALLTGCNGSAKKEPIWKHTKISDLAPTAGTENPDDRLKTITFNIYIFEMPAKNISTLDNAWQILYTNALEFNSYEAFNANSFLIGFGQDQMWNKIADLLRAAGAKKLETVTLLLSDKEASDVAIATLYDEQTVFYLWRDGSLDGTTMGPGTIALRVKAEKIPGSRGVCKLDVLPVFLPLTKSSIPQIAAREQSGEFLFKWCRFGSKMAPSDFIFLGPKRYVGSQTTLDSLIFSRNYDDEPVARTYLFVCSRITD